MDTQNPTPAGCVNDVAEFILADPAALSVLAHTPHKAPGIGSPGDTARRAQEDGRQWLLHLGTGGLHAWNATDGDKARVYEYPSHQGFTTAGSYN